MKDITLYANILFPIDFSDDSTQHFSKALNLALENKAELTVLYAFRIIKEEGTINNDVIELKYREESDAKQKFASMSDSLLRNHQLKTSFLCEIGFFLDRIMATVRSNRIDLVLISKSMDVLLKKETKNYKDVLSNSLSCKIEVLN